ncbi:MAG: 3-hydroxyacyl-CoA dehydrogenase family protein [Dehalococcoidia bacterium]|nr:3-hydroxyacyl-CoA dehydrogenase family protein [Dehalococcoidia bacterium]
MKAEDIRTVGVMGGGVMGGGIAQVLSVAGYSIILRDLTDELLDKTRATIVEGRFGLKGGVERGKITPQQMEQAIQRITFTTRTDDLRDVDLLIEAIPEDLDLKRKVFAELDALLRPDAILATNTSGFAIADINKAVSNKKRFMGMHWFSPVPVMKLIELVYAPETSEETIACLETVGERAGKVTIRVKDSPGQYGFVANRIFFAAVAEARKVLEESVASAEDIDKAMRFGFNWPAGPLEMMGGARRGWA